MKFRKTIRRFEAWRVWLFMVSSSFIALLSSTSCLPQIERGPDTAPTHTNTLPPGRTPWPPTLAVVTPSPGVLGTVAPGLLDPEEMEALRSGVSIDPADPRRFLYNGQPWYPVGYYPRIGALTADQTDYENYYRLLIDTLTSHRINYLRNVFNMGQPFGDAMTVYVRTGPGNAADGGPKVDLEQLNPEYFAYWRRVIEYAGERDMVVQLTIFDSWHNKLEIVHENAPGRVWGMRYDYYHGDNNINGIRANTPERWHDPEHPVFDVQKAMVRAVIDELGDLPNIIFEISNENNTNKAWELALADYLTEYQESKGQTPHLVMPRDLPNHDNAGAKRNEPGRAYAELIEKRALNQPLIADNDGGGHSGPNVRRHKAWAALTAGAHISYFHPDISWVDDLRSLNARLGMTYLGLTRKFLEDFSIDLRGMEPCAPYVSQGWCYGKPGQEYIVYLRNGGDVELRNLPGAFTASWFNPSNGASHPALGGPLFQPPNGQDWVLYVRAEPGE
jgi:hypothetical protein